MVKEEILENNNKTYKKIITHSKHFHKLFKAFGFQESIIPKLEKSKVEIIELHDTETNLIFRTTLGAFLEYGCVHEFKGFGRQIFLNIKYFSVENSEQLSLFGEEGFANA